MGWLPLPHFSLEVVHRGRQGPTPTDAEDDDAAGAQVKDLPETECLGTIHGEMVNWWSERRST
jgi:hypothetical protein